MPVSVHVKTFKSLGVVANKEEGEELVCDCPFCTHQDVFYLNQKEGLYHCKTCEARGNKYTFLHEYHNMWFNSTKKVHYNALSKARGNLPAEAFIEAELAYDKLSEQWLIPVRNPKGAIVNLRLWNEKAGILRNTSGCKTHLYNQQRINGRKKVFICEGEWDSIALEWFFKVCDIQGCATVACPGAMSFKKEWASEFNDKEVYVVFDNDDPGKKGMTKVINTLRVYAKCQKLSIISWPKGAPEKFDVRDYVTKNMKRKSRAIAEFFHMLEEVPLHDRAATGLARRTFKSVLKDFSKHIYLNQDLKDAILLQFSVLFSSQIPGDPLWLFIIGPPGVGKTLTLQALGDTEISHYESSLSPKTLVSGFVPQDGSDPSLLPRIIGKTLIIKEYTEIMSLSSGEQEQVFASLRGAYDGRVERTYPNGVIRVYPPFDSDHLTCHFAMLAGVTNSIHGNSRAALGERFLKFQLEPKDIIKQVQAAMNNVINQTIPEFEIRESASAFVEHKVSKNMKMPTVLKEHQEQIIGLAQIVSMIRATVSRTHGELAYRPVTEVGTRLAKQLLKLCQCVGFTLGLKETDDECYRLVKRVAFDTCYGWHRDIIITLSNGPRRGMSTEKISLAAVMSNSTTNRCIEDLYELGAITYYKKRAGVGGPPTRIFQLSQTLSELFDIAKLGTIEVPKVEPLTRRRGNYKKRIIEDHQYV